MEILKEIAPHVERVGLILHPETLPNIEILKAAEAAAPSLKVEVTALGVHNADEIARAVGAFATAPDRGLIIVPHAVTVLNSNLIVELSARYRLPAIYSFTSHARAGGLVSYGFDQINQFRQGATYVDRILKGAKPADLPVQYPAKYDLIINLKTAKALGLTIPHSFLQRADEVID